MKKLCLAVLLVVACKSSSSTTSQPSPQPPITESAPPVQPEPTTPTTPPPVQPEPTTPTVPDTTQQTPPTKTPPAKTPTTPVTSTTKPAMGESCGTGDACASGLECVKYYGIAGARGPEFKSCEVKCGGAKKGSCPSGTKCITIADGPGQVCRP